MSLMQVDGSILRQRFEALKKRFRISPMLVCCEADNLSPNTLNRVFNNDPKVEASSRRRVMDALDRLEARLMAG